MEEDHSTPNSHTLLHIAAGLLPMAAAPLSLHFTFSLTLTHLALKTCLFYRHFMATFSSTSSTKVAANSSSSSTMVAANSQWLVPTICCTCNGNNPTISRLEMKNASKVSNLFAGTREKCVGCDKTVYPIEKVTVNGTPYHRSCFKCTHGGCTISPSNYIAHEGKLYCKHHHIQLFKEKGNYSQLENEREKNPVVSITSVEIAAES